MERKPFENEKILEQFNELIYVGGISRISTYFYICEKYEMLGKRKLTETSVQCTYSRTQCNSILALLECNGTWKLQKKNKIK